MDYQPIKYLYYDKKTNKKNPAVKQGLRNHYAVTSISDSRNSINLLFM